METDYSSLEATAFRNFVQDYVIYKLVGPRLTKAEDEVESDEVE